MEKKSTKSVRARVILILILVIIAVLFGVLFVNRNNIKALIHGLTTDPGKIGELLQENQQQTKNALSDIGIDLSEDDFDKFNNGELSEEEIASIIYDGLEKGSQTAQGSSEPTETPKNENPSDTTVPDGKTDGANNPDTSVGKPTDGTGTAKTDTTPSTGKPTTDKTPSTGKTPSAGTQTSDTKHPGTVSGNTGKTDASGTMGNTVSPKLSEEEYNKKVAELVAKVYVIKANFTSTLSAFESRIISSYKALPEEQRTTATKASIVSENMSYVAGLEAQCDAQIKAVTDELSALMKDNGKDTSLVDAIKSAYANEKELKKAYYISLYK